MSAAPGPAELRRAVLARQLLLERTDLPLPRALEAMGGLQAQYAPSMYVGLWSRLRALERGAVTRGLEDRTLVQGTLMRATIHLVSREDYWPLALAVREPRRSWWHRADRAAPAPAAMAEAAERVRAAMADGPMTRKQVVELIGAEATRGLHIWLDLVRVPPTGTWEKRRADVWLDAERWLGPPPDLDADEARAHLVRRHLGAFGPAAPADVATWSGLTAGDLAGALERVAPERIVAADGAGLIDVAAAGRPATAPCRCASCRPGTRSCSSTCAARASCPTRTGPRSSPPATRTRTRSCWSTASFPVRGASSATRCR